MTPSTGFAVLMLTTCLRLGFGHPAGAFEFFGMPGFPHEETAMDALGPGGGSLDDALAEFVKRVQKAQAAKEAWELEGGPAGRENLRKEALRAYEEAELSYQSAVESETADPSRLNPQALTEARLEISRGMIDHAGIDGLADGVRKDLLRKARRRLVDFEIAFGDQPVAFEALLEEGRCLSELGNYQEAESRLRASLTLRKWLAKAGAPPTEYCERVMRRAYVVLAETLARAGRFDEAKTFIDQALRDEEGLAQSDAGPALKFQKARVLFWMKDSADAKTLAAEVVRQNAGRKWGILAGKMLDEWSKGADRDRSSRDK